MDNAAVPSTQVQQSELPAKIEGATRVCLLTLGGELYAVDLRNVREVFIVETITPVPGMPQALVGVTNLRGAVVPVMDLRILLGLPMAGPAPQYGVVIKNGNQQVSVLVERVPEIMTVQTDQFLPAPAGDSRAAKPFLTAVLRVDERMGGVVEVPALLACVETGLETTTERAAAEQ